MISLEEVRAEEALDRFDIEAAEVDGGAKRTVEGVATVLLKELVETVDILDPAEGVVMDELGEDLFCGFAGLENVLALEVSTPPLAAECGDLLRAMVAVCVSLAGPGAAQADRLVPAGDDPHANFVEVERSGKAGRFWLHAVAILREHDVGGRPDHDRHAKREGIGIDPRWTKLISFLCPAHARDDPGRATRSSVVHFNEPVTELLFEIRAIEESAAA